jgi:hypothetical protein
MKFCKAYTTNDVLGIVKIEMGEKSIISFRNMALLILVAIYVSQAQAAIPDIVGNFKLTPDVKVADYHGNTKVYSAKEGHSIVMKSLEAPVHIIEDSPVTLSHGVNVPREVVKDRLEMALPGNNVYFVNSNGARYIVVEMGSYAIETNPGDATGVDLSVIAPDETVTVSIHAGYRNITMDLMKEHLSMLHIPDTSTIAYNGVKTYQGTSIHKDALRTSWMAALV